jgi:glutathione S-transferase
MPHTLYVIHGSHPCLCAERALQLKRQPYRLVERPPALHRLMQKPRFGRGTVPAIELGSGERIVGSREILHRLDELVPDPPLLPADPAARARVEEAEAWGDRELQAAARRLTWTGIRRRPDAMASYAQGSKLGLPKPAVRLLAPFVSRVAMYGHGATFARSREDLAALPAQLDHVDALIAQGVIGGEQPNAADLQIAPSLRLLATFDDVRPQLEGRPGWAMAQRLFPEPATGKLPKGALVGL